jgi:hypothetical protein
MYSSVITEPTGVGHCIDEDHGLDVATLARLPRWDAARVEALPGRCRGSVLARWGAACRRRWGGAAVARLRARLGPWFDELPEDPPEHAWFPVHMQIRLTDAVVEEFLGGDAGALEPILLEDIEHSLGRAKRAFLRTLGPGPILRQAGALHGHLYSVGQTTAEMSINGATVHSTGARLFANPTWQLLQVLANRGLIRFTGRELHTVVARMTAADGFAVELHWS